MNPVVQKMRLKRTSQGDRGKNYWSQTPLDATVDQLFCPSDGTTFREEHQVFLQHTLEGKRTHGHRCHGLQTFSHRTYSVNETGSMIWENHLEEKSNMAQGHGVGCKARNCPGGCVPTSDSSTPFSVTPRRLPVNSLLFKNQPQLTSVVYNQRSNTPVLP